MEFTWTYPQLIVNPTEQGLPNVVVAINWVCTGTDGNKSASSSGTVRLPSPNPAEFIPFDQITNDMAATWVKSMLNADAVEKSIERRIALASIPVLEPRPLAS